MSEYKLEKVFPVIKSIIREINQINDKWADRDSIKDKLLMNKSLNAYIHEIKNLKRDDEWIAGNMVDWFSAHFTKGTNFMEEYRKEFEKKRVEKINSKGIKRKIWAYKVLTTNIPEEIDASEINPYNEGAATKIYVNKYERNKKARDECISYHGYDCKVCGFNFKSIYSPIGEKFIHVHHLMPISKIRKEYEVNPITDLIPVCPNCHAMLHDKNPPLTIEELKKIILRNKVIK